jgi:hypothetical protein
MCKTKLHKKPKHEQNHGKPNVKKTHCTTVERNAAQTSHNHTTPKQGTQHKKCSEKQNEGQSTAENGFTFETRLSV